MNCFRTSVAEDDSIHFSPAIGVSNGDSSRSDLASHELNTVHF